MALAPAELPASAGVQTGILLVQSPVAITGISIALACLGVCQIRCVALM